MTKAHLIDKIAGNAKITKVAADRVLEAFIESVKETLITEGKITLSGFGTFAAEMRKARKGRNPRTGETITIPAAKMIKFRPGKTLKDSIN